ncbi:uncharacterized protein FA14DRAFT_27511 [Meira miltonrushii]|uniref:BHLH domain-containing protein n=1 Tax=Meira miltonrushii TaxID=1280837 RepID=A0A316VMG8_9BASI|nr:uncharacterized protein FA14DRAFT_27511 [Meira miltonrushii]PWN38500.1 hypothetical protein FA14DRAFT_27511 [Meira miltonrushii]
MAANSNDGEAVTSNGSTSTTNTTRKNRPLRRKTSHSVIERRRREKINEGLISLQHLVPACRDELHELLLSKAQSNKRNLKRSKQEVEKEVEGLLQQKIESQMVLEKLCIISHTVDYVRELQASLAAYRKMCGCSPPLAAQDGAAPAKTHGQVHLMDPEGDEYLIKAGSKHADGSESSPEAEEDCIKCTISRAKRRRHWGSNHPLQLATVHTYDGSSSNTQEHQSRLERPRRKAAPTLHTMREESVESISEDGEISARSLPNTVNQESDEIIDGDSDDNASDLALDDWQERRQSHTDNGPVTPPLPFSVSYTQLYHTCSLRDERHKHDRRLQDAGQINLEDANIPAPNKSRSLMHPYARSSSDGEQQNIAHPPTFSRKRRATEISSYANDDYGTQKEVKRGKSIDSSDKTLNNKETCTDCMTPNTYIMGPKLGPNHRNAVRQTSPSDRLLHHSADANRLDLLANVVSRN